MIIISIYGGLGNQMFQYACGKAIAKRLGVELKLDISLVCDRTESENFTFRDFELEAFEISDEIASLKEVRHYVPNLWNSSFFSMKLYKLKRLLTRNIFYYEKTKYQFENRINSLKDNTLIYGYFQSEKYFNSIKSDLLEIFKLKDPIDIENNLLLNKIYNQNAVSIHIRRGDYLNSSFELLDFKNYYLKAIEIIKNRVTDPVFYFFSDDFSWVEKNFADLDIQKEFVKNNSGNKSCIDLFLMSQCKHNICANSTFSWWGAWLNNNPQKIVIAPRKWFNQGLFENCTYDLIPSDWLQV